MTHGALRPGGRVAIVEFVPNADRINPPGVAAFALTMLATTPGGDAYTLEELKGMLEDAGFTAVQAHPLASSQENAVLASKAS
jgi:hypothetical protein